MEKRRIGIALAVVCLLAAGMFALWRTGRPAAEEGEKSVTVQVIHSDGGQAEFTYRTDEESLGALLEEEGLISGTEGAYGLFVDTVDGETADYDADGSWWQLTCNGEASQTGADEVPLTDGGVYVWTFTR